MHDLTDDELLAELGATPVAQPVRAHTPEQERIIAGFEDILRFYQDHGRAPRHGEERDIFERLYAVRLDRLRALPDARGLLAPLDPHGLLDAGQHKADPVPDALDDDALLAELGVDKAPDSDITRLRHVRSTAQKRAAEDVAQRDKCPDFDRFQPLFEQVGADLRSGRRESRMIRKEAGLLKTDIRQGEFFILDGLTAYIAEVGKPMKAPNGENDARLRVIFSNGTQSAMLLRSLQRALYKDDASRRLTDPGAAGPLFVMEGATPFIGQLEEEADLASGTIYVLRSLSTHPLVAANRDVVHKIGVTGGSVSSRIAGAETDPTFLLAPVEIVADYKLFNINRLKLEQLIHRVFEPARLVIEIKDRFGNPVTPREWFLAPLAAIDQAVERIRDRTITDYTYDPETAQLVRLPRTGRS